MAPDGKLYALKRVALRGIDAATQAGYINEMELLHRLQGSEHIIQLLDAEVNRSEGYIHMVSVNAYASTVSISLESR
jgi:serine/threonine-protein kinase TTK/MPS1